jgi:antirestriction protein ArdC
MTTTKTRRATTTKPRFDPFQAVTDRIVALMEAGTNPWRKPWASGLGMPRSIGSGKDYRGINVFLLMVTAMEQGYTSPWWGTYRAIAAAGGQVRKGEKGTTVVFWSTFTPKDGADLDADGNPRPRFFLKAYTVFNAAQADGLPEQYHPAPAEPVGQFPAIEAAELVSAGYLDRTGLSVRHGGDRAAYSPAGDWIILPDREAFTGGPESYYATLFHELSHSTGHADRLARKELMTFGHFGDNLYAKEELVAELTAAIVCGVTGIGATTEENSAAYLTSWARVLKGDSKLVVRAATKAHAAAEMILGTTPDQQTDTPDAEPVMAYAVAA